MQYSLRSTRISCGYTVDEVARHFSVSQEKVRNVEGDSSDISYEGVLKIAEFYKVDPDLIFFGVTKR